MWTKITRARRDAFLRVLGECGNQTLAAERARVSRSWVCKWRGLDPDFDAAVKAAVAGARARLLAEKRDGTVPPKGWGHLDGVELAVRGTAGGGKLRVQIARAGLRDWSPAAERRFLDALGATCNVKAALAEVGKSKGSAYQHRKRWPAFARTWDHVLAEAHAALEVALFQNAENLFSTPDYVPETVIRDMGVRDAIHLLHMQKNKVYNIGRGPPGKRWRRPRTIEEVRESILKKLEAIARARETDPEDMARRAEAYAARRGA
ncbi:MAG TPA: hypothetical protein VIA98_14480 [Allosphingosinicella sp.]|jgi:hypothetical protein